MSKYLAAIDLGDEDSWQGVLKTVADMAKEIDGAKVYLMTVLPGINSWLGARYAIRGEMKGSEDYPLQEWKDEAAKKLEDIADKHIPKAQFGGVVVENGTVYREIVEAAKDLDITQIVMGHTVLHWLIIC